MRYLGATALFIFALSVGFIPSETVSAGTITASGKITITARVADTHYVIVDNQDSIIEITSNTTQLVTPRVFRGSITDANEITLTKAIHEQYRQLTISNQGSAGTLYKKPAAITEPGRQSYFLPLRSNTLSIINFLR